MPSAKIPLYAIGRFLSGALVSPCTVAADGTVTVATAAVAGALPVDLVTAGILKMAVFNGEVRDEDVKSATASMANHMRIADDFTVRVRELRSASGISVLQAIFQGVDYFRSAVSIGTYTLAAITLRGSIEDNYVEGGQEVELTGKACGIPYYWGPTAGLPF